MMSLTIFNNLSMWEEEFGSIVFGHSSQEWTISFSARPDLNDLFVVQVYLQFTQLFVFLVQYNGIIVALHS